MSSKVTPISLGGITSASSLFSNSFSVTTSWKNLSAQHYNLQKPNRCLLQVMLYMEGKCPNITLSDFFEQLESFWMLCSILIPWIMLQEFFLRNVNMPQAVGSYISSSFRRKCEKKHKENSNLLLERTNLASFLDDSVILCLRWWVRANPTILSTPVHKPAIDGDPYKKKFFIKFW